LACSTYGFEVTGEDRGAELDRYLARKARFPLEEARDLVRFGAVWVNRRREEDPSRSLAPGDEVSVSIPRYGVKRYYEADPARVLYRDPWILAYDKEADIPCQPTPYDSYNNVCEGLRRWVRSQGGPEEVRAGDAGRGAETQEPSGYLALHHRLDLAVSGVMVFALSTRANKSLFDAFQTRRVEKIYRAVVCGNPASEDWVQTAAIGRKAGKYLCVPRGQGKEAETGFRVLRRGRDRAVVEARPRTGRTHQIRLHLAWSGLPVLGDRQHGGQPFPRCMLHAHRIRLAHPVTGEEMALEAPVPEEFSRALGPEGTSSGQPDEC